MGEAFSGRRRPQAWMLGAAGALALTACGGKGGGAGASLPGPHWNEADACKTVDKAEVAKAAGQQVTGVQTVSPQPGAPAAVSMCTYSLTGGTATVMTRVSKDQDMSDAEIAQFDGAGGLMPKGEPVSGYGLKAWWSPQARQLQMVIDRRHYAAVVYGPALTLPGAPAPAGPDPKAVAMALGKTLL